MAAILPSARGSNDRYNLTEEAMIRLDQLNHLFRPEKLSWRRMALALLVALAADGLQIPFQAVPLAPEIIDVVAMGLTCAAVGFHLLLLPTFAVEFVPGVDMLPTWTGCVIAVIALRNREESARTAASKSATPPKLESLRNITPPAPPLEEIVPPQRKE